MSTQRSLGPLPSLKKTRPVAKKPTSQSKPSVTITPINATRAIATAVTTTIISSRDRPRGRGNGSKSPRQQRVSNLKPSNQNAGFYKTVDCGCFWSCPVHSTKNRIRDQPDHSDEWVWVCVCVCVLCACSVFLNRLSTSYLERFTRVDQFATIKLQNLKLLLVNTHDPCQNAITRSQKVN